MARVACHKEPHAAGKGAWLHHAQPCSKTGARASWMQIVGSPVKAHAVGPGTRNKVSCKSRCAGSVNIVQFPASGLGSSTEEDSAFGQGEARRLRAVAPRP